MSRRSASVESRKRCSLGWPSVLPRGRRKRFGYEVGTTTSCQFTSCFRTSEKPIFEETPNDSRRAPRRRSPSINKVRAPERAMVTARLEEIVDFPSFGTELVMSIVFGRGPSYGMKKIEDRILRYDSAKTCRASSG